MNEVNDKIDFDIFPHPDSLLVEADTNNFWQIKGGNFKVFYTKISVLETYKNSNENSLKFNIKKLNNELSDKEEQIYFLLSKNKEKRLIISSNKWK